MGKDPTVTDRDWFEDHFKIHDNSFAGLESDRDKLRTFIAAVKKFEDKHRGTAPKYVVFNELLKHGMSEDEVDEIIRILKSKSIIYEPHKGYLKLG